MKIFFKLIIVLAFFSMVSNVQAGGGCGGGGGLKPMSKFRQPKFKKYLDDKMLSFSKEGINNTKEFSKISKCHKMVFGAKTKVKAIEAVSLQKCQSMMKGDLAFQSEYVKQPSQNIVRSSIIDTNSYEQNKINSRRNSEKLSSTSSIGSKNKDKSLQDESLFFD
mgnify:CR=1 FL=1